MANGYYQEKLLPGEKVEFPLEKILFHPKSHQNSQIYHLSENEFPFIMVIVRFEFI